MVLKAPMQTSQNDGVQLVSRRCLPKIKKYALKKKRYLNSTFLETFSPFRLVLTTLLEI